MAFTLHQSGHGHSHGGLGSHGHSHEKKNGHSHANGNHYDPEDQGTAKKAQENASVRAAFVHVIGDLLQSVSVLVSALIIFFRVRSCAKDECCPNIGFNAVPNVQLSVLYSTKCFINILTTIFCTA